MNTFLLAAVAIGLVAFLVINRKRQAAAAGAPADERAPKRSRSRGRAKTRRDGTIQGYPDTVPEGPTAAAVAEAAASRTLAPVLEPLPAAAPAPPPAEPVAPPAGDWGFDEMIVEPGWPMPGEMAGAWPGGAPAADAPAAPVAPAPVAVEEPVAVQDDPVADEPTGEWAMPETASYAAPEPDPAAVEPQADIPWEEPAADAEPAMEAWVPGVSEVEPVVLPEPEEVVEAPEPVEAVEEPVLVWADPEPEPVATPEAAPIDYAVDEAAGPPAWQPEVPVTEIDVEVEIEEPVEALPAWEPEPEVIIEVAPVAVAVDEPWQPAAVTVAPLVVDADPEAEIDAVAEGLPEAVAALTPLVAAGDTRGVTPRMAAVLRALADEPRSLPELGRALGVSRPVVADVCARLEDLDLVWRERDPDDRRRTLVVPTLKGLKLGEEAVPGLDRDAVARALDRLSPAERAALVSAVRILREG